MSSDSEEDYEPWSDDDEQQAPARPPAPEALDAETLAALNSLDGETLAGQLWDVLGGLAVNCANNDDTARSVAARARDALTPREYAMALQPEAPAFRAQVSAHRISVSVSLRSCSGPISASLILFQSMSPPAGWISTHWTW